ncbi:phosphoribosyl-ATP diphosphatase [Falsiroseomonas ponticola]|uniref:phosphoribosyl-ATP diphosphatase n=1 Tax=Falsiroseomonas ponticola TaxID=2786951 RepID=UPI001CF7968B|nr:phosphoribosyl-ATP diphosphatase [Roseomonas ponticola]
MGKAATPKAKAPKPKAPKAKAPKAKVPKAKVPKAKMLKAKLPKAKKKALKVAAALPLPPTIPVAQQLAMPKAASAAGAGALAPFTVEGAEAAILDTLWRTVEARRAAGDVEHSHSARLLARGTAKVAQKLGEEAVECVIEATMGNRAATVLESADLLYHLMVLWVDAGIAPAEVWAELARRQGISGIAEKASRPKGLVRAANTTKLP